MGILTDGRPAIADWIIGNLDNGDQLALCSSHMAFWGLAQAKAGLPPEAIAEFLGPMFVTAGASEEGAPPKRGRAKAEPQPEPQPSEPAPQTVEEEPPATADG